MSTQNYTSDLINDSELYSLCHTELQAIIDSMHDGIWVIDSNGITLHVNQAMKRIANIDPNDVIGKPVTDSIASGAFASAVTISALEQKKVVTMFDDYACGTRCLNTSTPIFDSDGEVWRVVACIRDMTELEALQTRLVEAEMEVRSYRGQLLNMQEDNPAYLVANSKRMFQCVHDLKRAAKSPSGVLLLGETGTGKTLAASYIHNQSPRKKFSFIAVNCAAIPDTLIESELFGYEKGAFSGANLSGKKGYFELADNGTLFLDEIGELPLSMQAKLLHILDNQVFHKVGGEKTIKVDVRIIAATNRPLDKLVELGEFREDLYYRLNFLSVTIPPLREHPEDITELAFNFLEAACRKNGHIKTFSPKVLRCFASHTWPGNVRELRACVEFLAVMAEGNVIKISDLPKHILNLPFLQEQEDADDEDFGGLREAVRNVERNMIRTALVQTGSTHKAAKILGISQSSVVRKARQLGITVVE